MGTIPTIDFMKAFLRLLMSVLFVTAPLASPLRAQAAVVVSDTQAAQYIGQNVTVEGVVTAVSTSRKGNAFINFGGRVPEPDIHRLDSNWHAIGELCLATATQREEDKDHRKRGRNIARR